MPNSLPKRYFLFIIFLVNWNIGLAQNLPDTLPKSEILGQKDTLPIKEIIVTGYGGNRKLIETPASVVPITQADLRKYSTTTLVPILDAAPGVDFQERSPGNYRLSIRGSALRSAFNVRNVKVYWNEVPYTDAGGTSWLTPLDLHSFASLEIVKGPTGSAYGAGSGGTLLIRSRPGEEELGIHYTLDGQAGTFGMHGLNLAIGSKSPKQASYLNYSILKAEGYRVNSGIDRQMIHFTTQILLQPKEILTLSAFFADLHYQTPYGLTLAQYNADPKQARPPSSTNPGPIVNQTGEYVKKFFLGATHHYTWNDHLDNITSIGLSPDQIQNKSVNNIEKVLEQNFSFRSQTRYKFNVGAVHAKITLGGEYINSFQSDRNYGNLNGVPDSIQSDDQLNNIQWFIFSNIELTFSHNYYFTVGASLNKVSYTIQRLNYKPSFILKTGFDALISPRIALLKKINPNQSIYLSYSYGYSPPASSEVLPSTSIFNTSLQAEIAQDLELGYRGSFFHRLLDLDLTLFSNQIKHSIIRRSDSLGQDFYVNDGSSLEKGMEGLIRINPIQNAKSICSYLSFYGNITLNDFFFKEYFLNGKDLSGNPFTGVSPLVIISGIDARFQGGFYGNLNFHFSDKIPLNDQNTVKSNSYSVWGVKLGFIKYIGNKVEMEIFGGVDNALNKRYSLGNDINATGGRYFNPAPIRNFFLGITFRY